MRFLIELWPALLPLALYLLWMVFHRKKEVKRGNPAPKWLSGPWYWAVLASILVAAGCLLLLGLVQAPQKGSYEPPHLEQGSVVPGRISGE